MPRKFIACCGLICLVASVANFETKAISSPSYVTVVAGSFDRKDSVVSFAMPKGLKSKSYALRDKSSRLLPLQDATLFHQRLHRAGRDFLNKSLGRSVAWAF
jgi:hypothetical protein